MFYFCHFISPVFMVPLALYFLPNLFHHLSETEPFFLRGSRLSLFILQNPISSRFNRASENSFTPCFANLIYAYGNKRLIFLSKVLSTIADLERFRLRFLLFFVRMCLFPVFPRFTLPLLVSLKRFCAPFLVFNFGILFFHPPL